MTAEVNYDQYLKKIEKLKNALINKNWDDNFLQSKLTEITKVLKRRGICAGDDLLDNDLIEQLDELYFDENNKVNVNELYTQIYLSLFFKGKSTKKLREEFLPICYSSMKEREPTKREKLYDKIITLQYYEYNDYKENTKNRNHYINTFQQKYNEIKNIYAKMIKEGVDDDLYKYDKFDKQFFEKFLELLNDIHQEIFGKQNQQQKQQKQQNNSKNVAINTHGLNLVKGIPLQKRTFFYNKERLIYGEDMQIEYKNYSFPFTEMHKEEFKKQICGFLNSKGGRIFIGINDDKIVNGILLKYHDRDKNTNEIVNLTYDFYPKCRTNIDVNFIPIKNKDNKYIKNLYVIKIIVSQGEPNQLYSYTTRGFNSYLRLKGQVINLTAEEIRNELFKRAKNPEKKINKKEFEDPQPDNPDLIIDINSLEKQFTNMNLNNNQNNQKNQNTNKINNNQNNQKNHNLNFINNKNKIENDDDFDEEYNEFSDDEEEEEEEEENVPSRGRGRGRGNRGNRGAKRQERREQERNINKISKIRYTVKAIIITKTGKNPTRKELNSIFSGAKNCKKKFILNIKKPFGFLNFTNVQDANLFIKNFNYNSNLYEIRLNPKF